MKICFLARPSYDRYSVVILKKLRKRYNNNIEGYFITSNKKETKYISENINNVTIYETSKFLQENWNEFTENRLIEYEIKYDCAPIWGYILTDRFLMGKDYDYVVKITVGLFSFFEEVYKNHIDIYYSEAIATLQCYISYLVGKKYGTKYISQAQVRGSLDSEYHYFIDNPFQYDMNFNKNYKEINYSEEEKLNAEIYLKEFEEKYFLPPGQVQLRTKPKLKLKYLLLPIKRVIKSFDSLLNDKYSYMYYKSYKEITNPIKYYFNYQIAKKYYKKANYDEKYVYFPLHFQPEATTLVCAPKYENQLFFIDSLAKSLPAGTKFYVKEHYALLGNRDLKFYDDLKKFPNVILIDPWENSRKLIENAEAVVTLTGTAGYESMLLRKPTIIGGNTLFEDAPGVIKVEDIYNKYIDIMSKWKQPERKDIIQFLCASFRGYRKGNTYSQSFYNLIDDNIDDICESLYNQIIELGFSESIKME